ncbi:MAG: hypothetical protein LBQ84_02525 [Flavobacteriaceae bacterium]|jgi:hypothetical protein|nr:hypothetical protein [Flavobacteriaceae bacterium]
MKIHKLLVPVFSIFLFTACSSDDDNDSPGGGNGGGGGANGSLQITLEDARKHRVLKTVSYTYSGKDIGTLVNPGAAGKGVTWDFSGIDLNKYSYYSRWEREGRVENYSTSKYKDYFPDATECYVTTELTTTPSALIQSVSSDLYKYLKGNVDYGSVQSVHVAENSDIVSIANYEPGVTEPYPLYLGVKYTINAKGTNLSNGSVYSFDHINDIEIDGEGTLILPNGKIFTDVLRRKNKIADNAAQYTYISKQSGEVLTLIEGDFIRFTDEWL